MKRSSGIDSVGYRLGTVAILLLAEGIVFIAAPWLAAFVSDTQTALFALHLLVQPIVCASVSLICTRRGLNPMICVASVAAFLFLPLFIFRIMPNGWGMLLCAVCAVVFSSIGFELRKRGGKKNMKTKSPSRGRKVSRTR